MVQKQIYCQSLSVLPEVFANISKSCAKSKYKTLEFKMSLPMMIHRNRIVLLFDLLHMMLFRFEYLVLLALVNWKQCYCKHSVVHIWIYRTAIQKKNKHCENPTYSFTSGRREAWEFCQRTFSSTMSPLILLNDTLLFCRMNFFVDNNEGIMSSDGNARYKPPPGQQIGDYCSQLT